MNHIHGKGRLILYAFSGMGINMLNLMMGSYLCSALLKGGFVGDAIKFQTYTGYDLVVAAAWAAFVLIAKIIDGIIDIPMASVTDNMRTRWGRRRPSLVIGLVPMLLAFVLFLIIPNPSGVSWVNTIFYGVVLCVFYSFYTLTMVTYYATFTEVLENENDRNFVSNAKSVFDIFYFILGYVVVRMLLNGLNIRTVALIVLPLSLTMLIPLFMIKEPDMRIKGEGEEQAKTEQPPEKLSLVRSLAYTFKNRRFILWMLSYFMMTFSVQLFLGGINEYFSTVGMNMIFVMMAAFGPVPFTLILYDKFMKKHGFGVAFRYALIAFAVGMMAMFCVGFLPAGTLKTVLSVVTGLISSFAIGPMFAVAYSMPSQLAAEETEETGVSHSAMYFAVQGLFAGVASGIATGAVLVALKQTETVTFMTLICSLGSLAAFALTFLLPKSVSGMGRSGSKKASEEGKKE